MELIRIQLTSRARFHRGAADSLDRVVIGAAIDELRGGKRVFINFRGRIFPARVRYNCRKNANSSHVLSALLSDTSVSTATVSRRAGLHFAQFAWNVFRIPRVPEPYSPRIKKAKPGVNPGFAIARPVPLRELPYCIWMVWLLEDKIYPPPFVEFSRMAPFPTILLLPVPRVTLNTPVLGLIAPAGFELTVITPLLLVTIAVFATFVLNGVEDIAIFVSVTRPVGAGVQGERRIWFV